MQVEAKTRKLKKVWNKLQVAQAEIKDLTNEFQKEREDMLDTIRELNKQVKLRQLLVDSFIPPHEAERVSQRAGQGAPVSLQICATNVRRAAVAAAASRVHILAWTNLRQKDPMCCVCMLSACAHA